MLSLCQLVNNITLQNRHRRVTKVDHLEVANTFRVNSPRKAYKELAFR